VIAAGVGKPVQLLVGLNSVTRPDALAAAMSVRNITIRYFTHRSFHLKIYLFDDCALLGSGNLTNGGLFENREADICLDQPEDFDAVQEIRVLFAEMWDAAKVLNAAVFDTFATAWSANRPQRPGPDEAIEDAVGRVEPGNISVTSRTRSRERLFIDTLQRQIYEEYLPAFFLDHDRVGQGAMVGFLGVGCPASWRRGGNADELIRRYPSAGQAVSGRRI
jgi:phosphatidylserine/phosphatidylglycerophosphate/cardiolipin synthase-like enzyme